MLASLAVSSILDGPCLKDWWAAFGSGLGLVSLFLDIWRADQFAWNEHSGHRHLELFMFFPAAVAPPAVVIGLVGGAPVTNCAPISAVGLSVLFAVAISFIAAVVGAAAAGLGFDLGHGAKLPGARLSLRLALSAGFILLMAVRGASFAAEIIDVLDECQDHHAGVTSSARH